MSEVGLCQVPQVPEIQLTGQIAEVFGYAGDRKVALETLMAAGGWHHGADKPDFDENNEGLRRPICDMILLTFHLVISVLMYVLSICLICDGSKLMV